MIKNYSANDFNECCKLFIKTFNAPPWCDNWTYETADKYLEELTSDKRFLGYTVWDNDILTGVVFCHTKSHYKGSEIFVDELFVSPDYQHKGFGTLLMKKVEDYAKEKSFISITLLTSTGSIPFEFYKKSGYRYLDYLAFMYKRV